MGQTLSDLPWLARVDDVMLGRYQDVLIEQIELRKLLKKDGPVLVEPVLNRQGVKVGDKFVAHPAVAMLRSTGKELDALAAQLGLSPQARVRLGLVISQTAQANAQILATLIEDEDDNE